MAYQPLKPSDITVKTGGHIIQVFGLGGAGKSTFAIMSGDVAPQLFYARFDTRDSSRLLSKYNGALLYEEYFPPQTTKNGAVQQIHRYKQFLAFATKEGEGVFVEENAAAKWDMYQTAFLPDEEKVAPKEYAMGNSQMREDYDKLEDSRLWSILTAPAVPQWGMVSNAAGTKSSLGDTGQCAPAGWKFLRDPYDYHTIATIYLFNTGTILAVPPVPQERVLGGKFMGLIKAAKLMPPNVGVMLDNPTMKSVVEAVL